MSEPFGIAEQRGKIDEQIATLLSWVLELKLSRNLLSPAFRLPTEVLQNIFVFYRDAAVDSGSHQLTDTDWTVVAAVCSSWRAAAHSHSGLWKYIRYTPSHRPPGSYMEHLSGSYPLHVTIEFQQSRRGPDVIGEEIIPRITSLYLSNFPRLADIDELQYHGLSESAPALEHIEIHGQGYDEEDPESNIWSGFLGDDVPSLRIVRLSDIALEWSTTAFFRSVRELYMCSCYVDGSFTELADALNALNELRILSWDGVRMPDIDASNPPVPISLPKLEVLEILQGDRDIGEIFVLQALHTPQHLRVCQVFLTPFRNGGDEAIFVDFIQRCWAAMSSRGVVPYKIALHPRYQRLYIEEENGHELFRISVAFSLQSIHLPTIGAVTDIFDLSRIKELELSVSEYTNKDWIQPLAIRLSKLHTLVLNGSGWQRSSIIDEDTEDVTIFPLLKTIKLIDQINLPDVIPWLQHRFKCGVGVDSVTISGDWRRPSVEHVLELEACVPLVEFEPL